MLAQTVDFLQLGISLSPLNLVEQSQECLDHHVMLFIIDEFGYSSNNVALHFHGAHMYNLRMKVIEKKTHLLSAKMKITRAEPCTSRSFVLNS